MFKTKSKRMHRSSVRALAVIEGSTSLEPAQTYNGTVLQCHKHQQLTRRQKKALRNMQRGKDAMVNLIIRSDVVDGNTVQTRETTDGQRYRGANPVYTFVPHNPLIPHKGNYEKTVKGVPFVKARRKDNA